MDWTLTFRESQPVTIETCEQVLSAFVGGPVTTARPPFTGNPRDGFSREVTITAACPARDMTLGLHLWQEAWIFDAKDSDATATSLGRLELDAPPASFSTKFAAWHALRDTFAALGWTDRTLISSPRPIVDDAAAAGEQEIVSRLRSDITAALVAHAKNPDHYYEIRLSSPRADDIEAVLEAYIEPERIVFMTLADCGLRALPNAFGRFPNLEILHLSDIDIDGRALRRSLPKLYMLYLSRCALQTLCRDDLAGFPDLKHLSVSGTPLRDLDPNIIEVCPKLTGVDIKNTPLASDDARVAALRARWTNVAF